MSWPRREGQKNLVVGNPIHKSASFTHGATKGTNFGQDLKQDHVEENVELEKLENQLEKVLRVNKRGFHRKSTSDVCSGVSSNQQDLHFGQRRQLGKPEAQIKQTNNSWSGRTMIDPVLSEEVGTTTPRVPSTALEGDV